MKEEGIRCVTPFGSCNQSYYRVNLAWYGELAPLPLSWMEYFLDNKPMPPSGDLDLITAESHVSVGRRRGTE